MKLKKIFIILTIALAIYFYFVREDILAIYRFKDFIVWEKTNELNISDFEIKPNINSSENVNIWHGIYLKSNSFGDSKAYAIVDKSKSWIKDTSNLDSKSEVEFQRILFDVSEVYSRKINKKIKVLKYANYDSGIPFEVLKNEVRPIITKYEKLKQEIYDSKAENQVVEKWRPIINEMLTER